MKTETTPTNGLADDIQAWVEHCIQEGETVPDFWDEHDTSEKLALWLRGKGWRQT